MTVNSSIDTSQNKAFVIKNKRVLKQYAQKNYHLFGQGIIVVNLLLLDTENLEELDLISSEDDNEPTVHQPVAYIPKRSFWFKMIGLKIKKKHKINLLENDQNGKLLVVFVKDASVEHFSIYSIRVEKNQLTETD